MRRRRLSLYVRKYETNGKRKEGVSSVEGAITRDRIVRLYQEQKHLTLLATQARNQSRRRGSLIGNTSRSASSVRKRIWEMNKDCITRCWKYSSTYLPLDNSNASYRRRGRSRCGYCHKCLTRGKASGTQIWDMEKSKVG